jgi:histone H2A
MAKSTKQKKPSVSKSKRSGLVLAPPCVERVMRRYVPKSMRVGSTASVFLAACMEYLLMLTLHEAAGLTLEEKKKRVTQRHVFQALHSHPKLSKSHLAKVWIAGTWATPTLERVQLVKKPKTS